MPKPGKRQKETDFYKRYGFDIGDTLLVLPENDGRIISGFSEEELNDLISRAKKGKIVAASGKYGQIGRDGITGPFYNFIHIECEDGSKINCNPIYYRLYGRYDSLGLNIKPKSMGERVKQLKKRKLVKKNEELISRLKSQVS